MFKRKQHETDIAKQPYQGPSAAVAGAGESLLRGKVLLASGAVLGATLGAIFPTRSGKIIDTCLASVEKLRASDNYLIKGLGGFSKWSLEMGEHLVGWIKDFPGIKDQVVKLEKSKAANRFSTAVSGAILVSAITSFLGFFTGTKAGADRAVHGKKQVQALQREVLDLRDDGNDLRKKLVDTQRELETAQDELKHAKEATETLDYKPDVKHHPHRRASDIAPRESWAEEVSAQKTEREHKGLAV